MNVSLARVRKFHQVFSGDATGVQVVEDLPRGGGDMKRDRKIGLLCQAPESIMARVSVGDSVYGVAAKEDPPSPILAVLSNSFAPSSASDTEIWAMGMSLSGLGRQKSSIQSL